MESHRSQRDVFGTAPIGRIDRVERLNWYAAIGVPEYWLVDPQTQVLQQLALEGGVYRVVQALGGESSFAPASFPGLVIALGPLWALPES